jgi:hypothetical protein
MTPPILNIKYKYITFINIPTGCVAIINPINLFIYWKYSKYKHIYIYIPIISEDTPFD